MITTSRLFNWWAMPPAEHRQTLEPLGLQQAPLRRFDAAPARWRSAARARPAGRRCRPSPDSLARPRGPPASASVSSPLPVITTTGVAGACARTARKVSSPSLSGSDRSSSTASTGALGKRASACESRSRGRCRSGRCPCLLQPELASAACASSSSTRRIRSGRPAGPCGTKAVVAGGWITAWRRMMRSTHHELPLELFGRRESRLDVHRHARETIQHALDLGPDARQVDR